MRRGLAVTLALVLVLLVSGGVFSQTLTPGNFFPSFINIGGTGTNITQVRVYAPSLTPVATPAAIGTSSQTFTVTGLTTADKVHVNPPVPTSLCPMVSARASGADTLQLDFTTLTAPACTPAAGTYNVVAIRS